MKYFEYIILETRKFRYTYIEKTKTDSVQYSFRLDQLEYIHIHRFH